MVNRRCIEMPTSGLEELVVMMLDQQGDWLTGLASLEQRVTALGWMITNENC